MLGDSNGYTELLAAELNFGVTLVPQKSRVVVRVRGALDMSSAPRLHRVLEVLQHDGGAVVVDLSKVTFIDSAGLRVIVDHGQGPGDFVLANPSPRARKLVEICGSVKHP